jgi:hypothetical protein
LAQVSKAPNSSSADRESESDFFPKETSNEGEPITRRQVSLTLIYPIVRNSGLGPGLKKAALKNGRCYLR